jgi:hypothetical protein
MSCSTPINSQKLLTEPIRPHYTKAWNLHIQILILNSIKLLWSLKYVITITSWIKYMGCYSPPPLEKSHPEIYGWGEIHEVRIGTKYLDQEEDHGSSGRRSRLVN